MNGLAIRALIIEDSEDDVVLMIRELQRGGFDPAWVRVETAEATRRALHDEIWDVILSDYRMPVFSGTKALQILQETGLDIPFIIVSGTIGEETAVDAMKAGASDYLMKDNLNRLPVAVAREIRESEGRRARKEADRAIRLLARFPDESPDPILRIANDGTILYANEASAPLFQAWNFLHRERVPDLWLDYVGDALNEGALRHVEMPCGERTYAITLVPLPEENCVHFYGREMTAYKQVEEELKRSEDRYRRIVETAEEGIWLIDRQAVLVFANRKMADLLGTTVAELLGQSILNYVDEGSRSSVHGTIRYPPEASHQQQDVVFRRTDGGSVWTILSISPIVNQQGDLIGSLGMVTDISERKRLEKQLLQAQKMEAIGRLAGGIAHDFNNLGTVILGYSHLLLTTLGPDNPLRGDVQEIKKAAERASALTRQLLAFGRKHVQQLEVFNTDEVIQGMEGMLRRVLGEDVELTTRFGPEPKPIKADPGQFEQVLLNLVINARDAMPTGGTLTIETARETVTHGGKKASSIPCGQYVMIAVTDTGIGMDNQTQSQVFDPFFTTKEVGKGTGLGLSVVYGIVKQSGGHLTVESEQRRGTTFRIYMPICSEQVGGEKAPSGIKDVPQGPETILVVEDEPSVRTLSGTVLRSLGYRVEEASSGEEALQICEKGYESIDLLITDVVMPGVSGTDLVEQMKRRIAVRKVLYMSGYTEDTTVRHGVSADEEAFIQKPFSPETFAVKVRLILDKP